MKQIVLIGLLILAVVLSGCSEQENTRQNVGISPFEPEERTSAVGSNDVTEKIIINNYEFSPSTITISKGTTVIWVNEDSVEHSIDSDVGEVDSEEISPGETLAYKFDDPGTYKYHGGNNPSMKGTIIVK